MVRGRVGRPEAWRAVDADQEGEAGWDGREAGLVRHGRELRGIRAGEGPRLRPAPREARPSLVEQAEEPGEMDVPVPARRQPVMRDFGRGGFSGRVAVTSVVVIMGLAAVRHRAVMMGMVPASALPSMAMGGTPPIMPMAHLEPWPRPEQHEGGEQQLQGLVGRAPHAISSSYQSDSGRDLDLMTVSRRPRPLNGARPIAMMKEGR